MRDDDLVGCGHCGTGVVARLAAVCPFRQEAVCDSCSAAVLRVVTALQVQGSDPLARVSRRRLRTARRR